MSNVSANVEQEQPATTNSTNMTRPPFPKKKVAVLFGYCGSGYSGLQMNPDAHTIESVLMEALTKAGLIWERNQGDPKKVDWQRACRTDKGVHAAGNVVSLKALLVSPLDRQLESAAPGEKEWSSHFAVEQVNKWLPSGIRVFDIIKATNSFDSHTQCDSRYYEYIFPTALLSVDSLEAFITADSTTSGSSLADDDSSAQFTAMPPLGPEEEKRFKEFRVSKDQLGHLEKVLGLYCGTKSFHHFTIGKSASDPSSKRFIRSFAIQDQPFIDESDIEWVRVRVHGASFMLHQIRKMVGLAILAVKFNLNHKLIDDALSIDAFQKLNVPKAPSVGLYLDKAVFDGYNKYLKTSTATALPQDIIDFDKYEGVRESLKRALIYPAIFEPGVAVFAHWLTGLRAHNYEFEYLKGYSNI
jgi:tRNA pseudouridine38-40 synthase